MFFKNLTIYTLDPEFALPSAQELDAILRAKPLLPCSALSGWSLGWLPTFEGQYAFGYGKHTLINFGVNRKVLPASVVRKLTDEKVADFRQSKGFKPGRKAQAQIKELAITELLPRAFEQQQSTMIWIDGERHRVIVDTSSTARAESAIEHLRLTLGTLPVSLPNASGTAQELTEWALNFAPPPFVTLDECLLTSSDANAASVRHVRVPTERQKLRAHTDVGFRVSRIALSHADRYSMLVNDKLRVSRIRKTMEGEQAESLFESDVALMTGDLQQLINNLFNALKVE